MLQWLLAWWCMKLVGSADNNVEHSVRSETEIPRLSMTIRCTEARKHGNELKLRCFCASVQRT